MLKIQISNLIYHPIFTIQMILLSLVFGFKFTLVGFALLFTYPIYIVLAISKLGRCITSYIFVFSWVKIGFVYELGMINCVILGLVGMTVNWKYIKEYWETKKF